MAPGYEEFNNDGVPMVIRLLKSFYGLRQSPRCWYGTVDEGVAEIGFKSLNSDPCVYIYSEDGAIYVLTLYVDDVLLLGKGSSALVGCTRSRLTNPTRGESSCSDGDKYQASTAEARLLRSAGFRASVWCWR